FWYMWQTTFAFQKWSSLFEFKRYMNRMIFEFSRIETLEGVTRTPYNQYDSVILPLKKYLEGFGVDFMVNTKVTDLDFKAGRGITVSAIHLEEGSPINYDSKTDTTDGVISDIDNLENQSHLDGSDEEDSKSNNV
ncbi:oleate hydratase, partial [Klebsiella pneumoniae]|nr:oleate hydratase [Klebsiella pneumoniae]